MSTYYPDAAKRFTADITQHEMTVLHDDGLYRHLRFKQPGTYGYFFDLITWPGCLTVRGDMGTFTFARIEDMLDFFVSGGDINPQYWAEKLQGGKGDVEAYDPDVFRQFVTETYNEHVEEEPGASHLADLWNAIELDVLAFSEDEDGARAALRDFDFEAGGFRFVDTWEWRLTGYTYHYLWCCFAARWGAQQYRAHEAAQAVAA